jgi:hypothetical protein
MPLKWKRFSDKNKRNKKKKKQIDLQVSKNKNGSKALRKQKEIRYLKRTEDIASSRSLSQIVCHKRY